MTTDVKSKSSKPGTKVVKHKCIQKAKINEFENKLTEVHNIITGDGKPKEGMMFQMATLKEGQSDVLESLSEVKSGIKKTSG